MAKALRLFVSPDNFPILVHCIHGKDRTGMVVMLILLLSGVPVEVGMFKSLPWMQLMWLNVLAH